MKAAVLGAGGIIGQSMLLSVPEGIEAKFFRRKSDRLYRGIDMLLQSVEDSFPPNGPDAIVNLLGESNTDEVQRNPQEHGGIHVDVPVIISDWCNDHNAHYIHVSTQAVFSGEDPPYSAESERGPVNAYGEQKAEAERLIEFTCKRLTIVRPTFILGVRPIPNAGRKNPVEQMLEGQKKQVSDRFFSVLYAGDAAELLWEIVLEKPKEKIIHLGSVDSAHSRYEIARDLGLQPEPAAHTDFPGIAPRPVNTAYGEAKSKTGYEKTIRQCLLDYQSRETLGIGQRAKEIALFLGRREDECLSRLQLGFGWQHAAVREDFLKAKPEEPDTDDSKLLAWYRKTEAYIWELSAYHADEGFNYAGMCKGIAEKLKPNSLVLCLGDGIGDLSMSLRKAGHIPVYNDLSESRTAEFAAFRFWMYGAEIRQDLSKGWDDKFHTGPYDTIASLDFLEHVPDVSQWVLMIWDRLKPEGLFCAQNGFNMGSGPQGSIPMHLSRNDRFEKDWDPMLAEIGFVQLGPNWYQKPL